MDYRSLLDVTIELGYQLAMSGAETYRVEESITRIFAAYGITAEVFAITNCLTVSLETDHQKPLTRMRRIGHHGTDLDSVERYSNLSRRICAEKPAPDVAAIWLKEAIAAKRHYSMWIYVLGNILGAAGFILAYKGGFSDAVYGAICGLAVGFVSYFMAKLNVNMFFSTIASALVLGLTAYTANAFGLLINTEGVMISSLMLLVPGLLFTNAMRDIIYGDTNSGINRIVQVLLIGVAIALGTGAAWNIVSHISSAPLVNNSVPHSILMESLSTFIACMGFTILFNIHGWGSLLCALGGALSWALFRTLEICNVDTMLAYFSAAFFAAAYSEIMARIRKYPAISYLVVSIIPMLPGAGVYRATASIMTGDMAKFSQYGTQTIAIAGSIAVGILIVSTIARLWSHHQQRKSS